ncbi:MAG TPA: hemolysin family protein [Arenibaculum sp.]|nr:hemolysin family protein [Arenibaculum sp.]
MIVVQILVIVLLTVLNGIFAMSELALVSSRRARLEQMAASGSGGARAALRLMADPGRFLSTVQIGITLIGVVAGAYGGATLGIRLGAWLETLPGLAGRGQSLGFGLVIVSITYLSLIVGELVPKRIALKAPERTAAVIARPMLLLSRLTAPLVWLLGTSTDLLLRVLGLQGEREAAVTEDEVRSLITEGTRAGIFVPEEKAMIEGVLRLADRPVRSIMTPRHEVVWLDVEDSADQILAEVRGAGHTRFPVCRGQLDEVIGMVHVRELLDAVIERGTVDLGKIAVTCLVVHDGTPVLKLLDLMKTSGQHLAVAVDEYGGFEGVATLTDILETIAGDLPEPGETLERQAARRGDGSWLVDGAMPVDEFEDVSGLRGLRDQGGFHTMAGYVLHQLGRVPAAGDAFERDGTRYEVVDMDGRRIDKLLVVPAAPESGTGDA